MPLVTSTACLPSRHLPQLLGNGTCYSPNGPCPIWRVALGDAEYKHVVLGLIFLKYVSDALEEAHLNRPGFNGDSVH